MKALRAPWPLRAIALLFLICCGCRTSSHSEIQTSATQSVETHAASQSDTVTTVTQGPGRTIVLEFAPPEEERAVLPGATDRQVEAAVAARSDTRNLPPHGALLKATITETGPVVQETHSEGHTATETHADGKSGTLLVQDAESEPATGCAFGLGFWLAIGLMAAGVLAWVLRGLWWPK